MLQTLVIHSFLQMSPAGLEPTTHGLKVPERPDATSLPSDGCAGGQEGARDNSELTRLIDEWPQYSPAKQAAILALAGAAID